MIFGRFLLWKNDSQTCRQKNGGTPPSLKQQLRLTSRSPKLRTLLDSTLDSTQESLSSLDGRTSFLLIHPEKQTPALSSIHLSKPRKKPALILTGTLSSPSTRRLNCVPAAGKSDKIAELTPSYFKNLS